MNLPRLPEGGWPSAICVFHREAVVIVEAVELVLFPGSQTHNAIFNDAHRILCRLGVRALYIGLAVPLQKGCDPIEGPRGDWLAWMPLKARGHKRWPQLQKCRALEVNLPIINTINQSIRKSFGCPTH
jgi:hypothetical protein